MTGKPGMLLSVGLQRVRHNLAMEQQYQEISSGISKHTIVDFCFSFKSELKLKTFARGLS